MMDDKTCSKCVHGVCKYNAVSRYWGQDIANQHDDFYEIIMYHYSVAIMSAMASQITSLTIVYSGTN